MEFGLSEEQVLLVDTVNKYLDTSHRCREYGILQTSRMMRTSGKA